MSTFDNIYDLSNYDCLTNLNGTVIHETKYFTQNIDHIITIQQDHPFIKYLNDYTYNIFADSLSLFIKHAYMYNLNDNITYLKIFVKSNTPAIIKSAIHNAWTKYSYNVSNHIYIYADYCSKLFICDDYEFNELYFSKELLKCLLDQEPLNKYAFNVISNYIYNYVDNEIDIN